MIHIVSPTLVLADCFYVFCVHATTFHLMPDAHAYKSESHYKKEFFLRENSFFPTHSKRVSNESC